MISPGLCTLTLGHLKPEEVIELCLETGLTHVEWWGRNVGHVPMGDLSKAKEVADLTQKSSLEVSTYGSYYRVGESEAQNLSFKSVLKTSEALGAPAIRVWAGTKGSESATKDQRQVVIDDVLRIADMASEKGIRIVFEHHQNTLTDTLESTRDLIRKTEHSFLKFSWQVQTKLPANKRAQSLQEMLPYLDTIHVFNWSVSSEGKFLRHALCEAETEWKNYFELIRETGRDHVALLEFVKDNSVDQFIDDANALRRLLDF